MGKKNQITWRMNILHSYRKDTLQAMVRRVYRVVDLRGVNRDLLVTMILEAEFGRVRMEAWHCQRGRVKER